MMGYVISQTPTTIAKSEALCGPNQLLLIAKVAGLSNFPTFITSQPSTTYITAVHVVLDAAGGPFLKLRMIHR